MAGMPKKMLEIPRATLAADPIMLAPYKKDLIMPILYYTKFCQRMQIVGASRGIRTPNRLVRSQGLYPVELGTHASTV